MKITACTVDSELKVYQCYSKKSGAVSYPFEDPFGSELECALPSDIESFLKACLKNEIIQIPLCSYQGFQLFMCNDPDGQKRVINLDQADRMSCMLKKDRKRVISRCPLL